MKFWLLLFGLSFLLPAWGVETETYYAFRVYLKNKGNSELIFNQAEQFLSAKAIGRREKQHISITTSDLPISTDYIDSLKYVGGRIVTRSKWLSTVVVESPDSTIANKLARLSIVDSVKWVWKGRHQNSSQQRDTSEIVVSEDWDKDFYGCAGRQIKMLKGDKLHRKGFRGKGMTIAVIDAGFDNVDRLNAFKQTEIRGTSNQVHPENTVFVGDDHGTKVLSCMAANLPNRLVGTAPDAAYWLIKSEVSESEFPIEEDFWASAVEFADSVGVDIISSSLGYFTYDEPSMSYTHEQLDGKTAVISRVASMAAEKGILLFSSAGNEGNTKWRKITVPADASNIMTVGAVTNKCKHSEFSSVGFTADGRIKPDVVAMGTGCSVIEPDGAIRFANGTSFSTPILAGMAACLWQALPELNVLEIQQLIRSNASRYKHPDAELGYGIPNMYKSYKKGLKYVSRRR